MGICVPSKYEYFRVTKSGRIRSEVNRRISEINLVPQTKPLKRPLPTTEDNINLLRKTAVAA
jgi:hypothetical protein